MEGNTLFTLHTVIIAFSSGTNRSAFVWNATQVCRFIFFLFQHCQNTSISSNKLRKHKIKLTELMSLQTVRTTLFNPFVRHRQPNFTRVLLRNKSSADGTLNSDSWTEKKIRVKSCTHRHTQTHTHSLSGSKSFRTNELKIYFSLNWLAPRDIQYNESVEKWSGNKFPCCYCCCYWPTRTKERSGKDSSPSSAKSVERVDDELFSFFLRC